MVHRVGEAALLPERLALVAEYYGEAFSADLMAGLPGQGEDLLLADIERLLAYHPGHVSLYALTVEPGTPLGSGGVPLPDPEEADRLWLAGRDALEKAGYAQYEVSNFALPGKQALHNIRYWRMENWLAAGPAASATVIDDAAGTGFRYTVAPDLERYLGEPLRGAGKIEFLDRLTLMKETCLMGFRYLEGPDREGFKTRFGGDIETFLPRSFAKWRAKGLMRRDKTALNREGLLFLNPFLADLFTELETGP
jgi:oxygen-independent coproporphyrinogen-3 oxidase